jgi:type I restriction enzyme S subunit
MGGEWREYRIGDIAKVIGGSTPSTSDPSNFDGDVPWLTPKDLSSPHDRFVLRGQRNLSRKGLQSCSAQLLPPKAVLLSSRAPIGYVAIAKGPIATNQGFRNLVLGPGFEPEFVYYWLTANRDELERHASGSTFKELSGSALKQIRIRVPPFPEQRAIAHILGTLDDKIELNRKQNETLEAMARALFRAWFVDFEPVRAKIEDRWQRGQSLPGMPAHLYDLFPDRLVDSELGEIPEGWRIFSFGDVAHQAKGTVNPSAASHETFTHYSLPAFDAGQIPNTESGDAIKSNKTPVPNSAVLISKLNPHIPRIWLIGKAGKNAVCSTEFIAWVPKAPANSSFLYCLASSPEFNSAMQQLVTGTSNSHQRVKPEQLRDIRVFAANQKAIEAFSDVVSCLMDQVLENRQQSRSLAQLRDTLLPKLISGELRVTEAMLQIEGASA